jgi:hypothetical protein
MSDIADALGGAAEGALVARAIEPKAGEAGADGHTHETNCLNCGTPLVGPHCHVCGQRGHVHRTIGAFFHDLLHGALHFEGKTWRTLPMLAWRPGELTRRYIDGERARFVSPMALFLFSVFLMFAVFQVAGITAPTEFNPVVQSGETGSVEQLAELRAARAEMEDGNPGAFFIDRQIAALEREIGGEDGGSQPGETALTSETGGQITSVKTGWAFLDNGIEKWQKNPGLMAYKLQANSYKFSWLLIPLSVPFVWLIFAWRRKFGAYDHAVFVTYSLSFMTLLFVVLTLLGQTGVGSGWLITAATTIPLYHIYRQLKGAYGLSRFSAVWRTVVLTGFIGMILMLFLNLLLVLGALG